MNNSIKRNEQLAREKALFAYSQALSRGDFESIAKILTQAEHDPILAQCIDDLNDYYDHESRLLPGQPVISPNGHHPKLEKTMVMIEKFPRPRLFPVRLGMLPLLAAMLAIVPGIMLLIALHQNLTPSTQSGATVAASTASASPTPTATATDTATARILPVSANWSTGKISFNIPKGNPAFKDGINGNIKLDFSTPTPFSPILCNILFNLGTQQLQASGVSLQLNAIDFMAGSISNSQEIRITVRGQFSSPTGAVGIIKIDLLDQNADTQNLVNNLVWVALPISDSTLTPVPTSTLIPSPTLIAQATVPFSKSVSTNPLTATSLPTTNPDQTPTVTPLPAGSARTDSLGISQMWVPAGCFKMGSDPAKDSQALANEQPAHDVCLTHGYWMDQYDVTNAAFDTFVAAGAYGTNIYWSADGLNWKQSKNITAPNSSCKQRSSYSQQPRVCVSWYEAEAYANWRTKTDKDGIVYRLPTEAEWEYAARGPTSLIYPWGDTFDNSKANTGATGLFSPQETAPVGSYPGGKSWVGVQDMSGNAWQWVADWYDYYPNSPQNDPIGPTSGTTRVLRGGSWFNDQNFARSAYRWNYYPGLLNPTVGFRLVGIVPS